MASGAGRKVIESIAMQLFLLAHTELMGGGGRNKSGKMNGKKGSHKKWRKIDGRWRKEEGKMREKVQRNMGRGRGEGRETRDQPADWTTSSSCGGRGRPSLFCPLPSGRLKKVFRRPLQNPSPPLPSPPFFKPAGRPCHPVPADTPFVCFLRASPLPPLPLPFASSRPAGPSPAPFRPFCVFLVAFAFFPVHSNLVRRKAPSLSRRRVRSLALCPGLFPSLFMPSPCTHSAVPHGEMKAKCVPDAGNAKKWAEIGQMGKGLGALPLVHSFAILVAIPPPTLPIPTAMLPPPPPFFLIFLPFWSLYPPPPTSHGKSPPPLPPFPLFLLLPPFTNLCVCQFGHSLPPLHPFVSAHFHSFCPIHSFIFIQFPPSNSLAAPNSEGASLAPPRLPIAVFGWT